ncbi:hypothetical protein [Bifidobacterium catenulatum]|uniref:hypothetical protein n=1 Tax=Bifidobacterium catenulatum TaxID=1686 RepID=UPI0022E2D211|nr:hypothetical protein [Bifidobacterium catenulatum]
MNDIRKACVRAVFDEFDDHGDVIRPAVDAETLLMPPAPPRDTVIMFGLTGYAIRIQEDKSGQLIELHADGEEVLADIPESTLDNFAYSLNDDLGNMR